MRERRKQRAKCAQATRAAAAPPRRARMMCTCGCLQPLPLPLWEISCTCTTKRCREPNCKRGQQGHPCVEETVRTRCCGAANVTTTGGLRWLNSNVLRQLLERGAGRALRQPPTVARSMRTPPRGWARHSGAATAPACGPAKPWQAAQAVTPCCCMPCLGWAASSGGCCRDAPKMHDTTSRLRVRLGGRGGLWLPAERLDAQPTVFNLWG